MDALMNFALMGECGVIVAEKQTLRNLSRHKPPFYARGDFLK